MIAGSCHCGKVEFQISKEPQWLVSCNCSICRRVGALWAHLPADQVSVVAPKNGTIEYIQGDRMLAIHSCINCGCTTHWTSLSSEPAATMAVNFHMCDQADIAKFRVRRFDGADSWRFLDGESSEV